MFKEVYALATAFMFAILGIFAKSIYESAITADTMFFMVCVTSVAFFFLLERATNNKSQLLKISKRNFVLSFCTGGFLCLFLTNFSVLIALQYIDTGIQRIITYSAPLFSILYYAIFYKKKPLATDILSVILIISGLYLVVGGIDISLNSNVLKGLFFSFIASISIGSYSTISEEEKTSLSSNMYWFYAFLGGLFFSSIQILIKQDFTNFVYLLNTKVIFLIALSSILCFALPYVTFLKSINLIGAVKTGIIVSLTPVMSIILGIIFLDERLTILQFFGSFFIVCSSVIVSLPSKKQEEVIIK